MTFPLILLCFALFGMTSGGMGAPASSCKAGAILVPSQKICVQLVTEKFAFLGAKKKCTSMGGKLLNAANAEVLQAVRVVLNDTVQSKQLTTAWIGLLANTAKGSMVLLDGTDSTAGHYPPDFWAFNGNPPEKFFTQAQTCMKQYANSETCIDWAKALACMIKPIKNLSPKAGADFKLLQQLIRTDIYVDPRIADEPGCLKQLKSDFSLGKTVKFNKAKPTIALAMDLPHGWDGGFIDTFFTTATVKLPVVCQFAPK